MANEPTGKGGKALKVLPPGQEVERANVAPDGTVTVAHARGKLTSVDIADVDLLLSFSDGSFVIVPNGALDALAGDSRNIVFPDARLPLAQVFKLAGIANPAKAGSLRLVSEAIDAAKPPADEAPPPEETVVEPPAPPAPMVKVSAGTSPGNKGAGKGPGAGGSGSGEGEGEVPATVTPLQTPIPPVFRIGQKTPTVDDLLSGTGLGTPNFTQTLFTSSEFKVTPSGRTDLPAGAFDPSADSTQLATRANPASQATREVINGTPGADTIDINPAFSSGVGQWAKALHFTINNFASLSDIEIALTASPADVARIPDMGFELQGLNGVVITRDSPTGYTWHVTPTADMLINGFDLAVLYDVNDSAAPLDFGANITISGMAGPFAFEVTNNAYFTWRDAVSESDFTVYNNAGDLVMVLPRAGVGVEVFAGLGNDVVNAGAGPDLMHGGDGDDSLSGGLGNDTLEGGTGADMLIGNQGSDTATYANAAATAPSIGIVVRLDADGSNTGEALGDQLAGRSIENLIGSAFNDTLVGDGANNSLAGGQGNDRLLGLNGSNTLDGGDGVDTVSYESVTNDITANLTTNRTTVVGSAFSDTLAGIENLVGGSANDTFIARSETNPAATQLWIEEANAFDGGTAGTDTVSYASALANVVATLNPALLTISPMAQSHDALGDTFTSIENLTGSSYDDTLVGDNSANVLTGGAGDDVLEGLDGADTFAGGAGNNDTVSYANSVPVAGVGVVSSLTTLFGFGPAVTQTNDADGDTYSGIENMLGSSGHDVLIGENHDNLIQGGDGNDTLEGMAGADSIEGGDGTDTASYAHSSGVLATLTTGLTGVVASGDAGGDVYLSIENLTGSGFADTLIGDGGGNSISGGDGNDILEGLAGADSLDGGNGTNTASYEHSADAGGGVGVTASLTTPASNAGDAAGDVYTNIQNLTGSAFADNLTGNASANSLVGGGGNDTLSGLAGVDQLYGDAGNDDLTDDMAGTATLQGGEGDDIIRMTSSDNQIDIIAGGNGIDELVWASATAYRVDINMVAGTVYFYGPVAGTYTNFSGIENFTAAGANNAYVYASNVDNRITGGSGVDDWVDYRYAVAGVNANLQTGVVTGGSGTDTLAGIEHLYAGTAWDDVLIGNDAANWIRGGSGGNDTIDGGNGIDTWYIDWNGNSVTASLLTAGQNAALGIVMTGDAAGDVVSNVERIYSSYGDFLYGNNGDNYLYGRGLLEGFSGADQLQGSATTSTASYANSGNATAFAQGLTSAAGTGVTATLTAGLSGVTASGDAVGDTYTGTLNNLTGSAYADALYGNASVNTLSGGGGDDLLEGLAGGDVFQGGTGTDTVTFVHSGSGVTADLSMTLTGTNDALSDLFFSIENLTGTNSNDNLYGDGNNNVIDGLLGTNLIDGRGGFDTASYLSSAGAVTINLATNSVTGSGRTDTLVSIERVIGSNSGDNVTGTTGDDWIDAGGGADTVNGAAGSDTISYASATGAVLVNLTLATQADGKQLTSMENIFGSNNVNGDILTGDGNDNVIEGGLGDDTLAGGTQGVGGDTVSYAYATAAVGVNISGAGVAGVAAGASSGGAGSDVLSAFENITGSAYDDTLVGDAGNNSLSGGDGNDVIYSGGGTDTVTGGNGTDTLSYANIAGPVAATLGAGGITTVENLVGSSGNDTLTGDGTNNVIEGGAGDDTLVGGVGTDTVSYASAAAGVTVNLGLALDHATGGAGTDQLSQFENILGSANADTLTGDGSANVIEGGAGNDILNGFGGGDTVSYSLASSGVSVNIHTAAVLGISAGQATGGAGTDTLSNFQHITGSGFADTLIGSAAANNIDGGAGDDLLVGGAGGDTLTGGTGTDTVSYVNAGVGVQATLGGAALTHTNDAFGDVFSDIENLTGSSFADILYGNSLANVLTGSAGNDQLRGYDGNDTIDSRLDHDTNYGGNGDDTFWVDATTATMAANLPTRLYGEGNNATAFGGGDAVKLFGLVGGQNYSLTALANVTDTTEILDMRDGVASTLTLTSADVRNFVDGGNGSQIWVRANAGDTISLSLVAGETFQQATVNASVIDYTIFNAAGTQVGQIHWQVA